jgi:hypothetical protein
MFGDPVVAAVILDRFLHHSQVVTNRGDSRRLRVQFALSFQSPCGAARRVIQRLLLALTRQ